MRNYILPVIFISVLLIIGCIKKPEIIQSPGIKIDVIIKDNVETYSLRFSGGIQNDNPNTAFIDLKGRAVFTDPDNKGKKVDSIEFNLPAVLPFDSGIIDTSLTRSESEIKPLIDLLDIDLEKLKKDKSVEKFNIDEKYIKLDFISFNKKDIIKLLKEKVNEKN